MDFENKVYYGGCFFLVFIILNLRLLERENKIKILMLNIYIENYFNLINILFCYFFFYLSYR